MKNFVRVMSVMLVVAMLAVTLVACGGVPSGTYVNGDTSLTKTYTQYEFKGSKVVFTSYVGGNKVEAISFELTATRSPSPGRTPRARRRPTPLLMPRTRMAPSRSAC